MFLRGRKMEESISERIKRIRKEKGLNQSELSEKTGISQRSISAIENGVTDPSTKQIKAISEFFNVSKDYLIDGKEGENTISKSEQEIIQLVRKDSDIKETLLKFLDAKKKAIYQVMNHELMAA
jgi:transcriptional regulator with XRE-family HTH domain